MSKYESTHYIHKDIRFLIEKVNLIRQEYLIYKRLKFEKDYSNIKKAIPISLNYLLNALFEKILIELSKLLGDDGEKNLCINSFIERYKNNRTLYKEKKYYMVKEIDSNKKHRVYLNSKDISVHMNNLDKLLSNNIDIIEYIRLLRNKKLAHNDRKLIYDPRKKPKALKNKILYIEIWNLIDDLFNQLNKIYLSLFAGQYSPLDAGEFELKRLNNILENNT